MEDVLKLGCGYENNIKFNENSVSQIHATLKYKLCWLRYPNQPNNILLL